MDLREDLREDGDRAAPTAGGDDELLIDLPEQSPGGAFDGYRRSQRVRWFVAGALGLGTIGALWGGSWYVDYLERQARRGIKPSYDAPPANVSPEDRVMHWDAGPARLGLSREPPGVNLIVLPDRELRLAEGYDSAQISVRVENNRTVKLRVLTGRIDVVRRDASVGEPDDGGER
ncbi:MAG: hypothetical protein AAGA54_16655 [Myxococcota bacterium]